MGYLRFFLALSVFYTHVDAPFNFLRLTGGATAVESFFVISGFLMAEIATRNNYKQRDFYISRLLRIYPTYFVAMFLLLIHGILIKSFGQSQGFATFTLKGLIPNFTIFGQDVIYFLDSGLHIFPGLQEILILGVAWTLALELYFYVMVPYISRISTKYLGLICASILLAKFIAFNTFGLNFFFANRFFGFELGFFLFGFVIHQIRIPRFLGLIASVLVFAIPVIFPIYRFGNQINSHSWYTMVFPLLCGLALPVLFAWDSKFPLARSIGKISFPLYLFHTVVAAYLISLISFSGLKIQPKFTGLVILALTIFFSILSIRFLEAPLDRVRHKFRK